MRGGGKWTEQLGEIARIVEGLGHFPLTEVSSKKHHDIDVEGSGDHWIYNRDMKWLEISECMIAEVSSPSLGVGYEIAVALHVGRMPVLALCHDSVKILSAMIHGNTSELMELRYYSKVEDMTAKIQDFLSKIADNQS